jgi:hypothetical protein
VRLKSHEITGLDHSDGTSSLNKHVLIEKKKGKVMFMYPDE